MDKAFGLITLSIKKGAIICNPSSLVQMTNVILLLTRLSSTHLASAFFIFRSKLGCVREELNKTRNRPHNRYDPARISPFYRRPSIFQRPLSRNRQPQNLRVGKQTVRYCATDKTMSSQSILILNSSGIYRASGVAAWLLY